jgi:hypothetical protein
MCATRLLVLASLPTLHADDLQAPTNATRDSTDAETGRDSHPLPLGSNRQSRDIVHVYRRPDSSMSKRSSKAVPFLPTVITLAISTGGGPSERAILTLAPCETSRRTTRGCSSLHLRRRMLLVAGGIDIAGRRNLTRSSRRYTG